MNNGASQYVSMIEPKHDFPAATPAPKKRRLVPFIVIGVIVILLVVLVVVLLSITKSDTKTSADYSRTYQCAIDEYNFRSEVFDMEFSLKSDNTYKIAIGEDRYSTGTFSENNRTYATGEDGASEINYCLTLKREKSFLDGKDITEATGDEVAYVLNINEKSDTVVLMNEQDQSTFYCREKK